MKGVVLGVVLTLLSACGAEKGVSSNSDQTYVEEHMKSRLGSVARVDVYRRIEQLLPNRQYQEEEDKPPFRISDRVVVGEFVEATPGYAFLGTGKQVPFNSREAEWRTVHFEFRVDETFGGEGPNPARIGIAFSSATDFDKIREGHIGRGKSVVFLFMNSPVLDYDPDLAAVVEDGAMIATVNSDDRLSLDFLDADRNAVMLERVDTLEELRREARKPQRTIKVKRDQGVLQPAEE